MMKACRALAVAFAEMLLATTLVPREAAASLVYDLSLGAGVTYSDNFYNDPDSGDAGQREPVHEATYSLAPALRLTWELPHDRLSLGYGGQMSAYGGDENLDSRWTHALNANLSWRRWSPFFLEASETLSREAQPQERDVQSEYDYTYTNVLAVRTGLARELSARATAELAYSLYLETYPDVEDADQVQRHYGEGLVHYAWTPLVGSDFRVSYGRVERELSSDYDELSVSGAVNQRLSEHLALQYGVDWIRESHEEAPEGGEAEDQGTVTTLLTSARLSGDLRGGGSWALGYSEGLDYMDDGDTLETKRASADVLLRSRLGSTLTAGVWYEDLNYRLSTREEKPYGATMGARWVILPWLAATIGGQWSKNKIQEDGMADVDEDYYQVSTGLIAAAGRHVTLRVGYQHARNDSDDENREYSRNQVSAWATYHLRALVPGQFGGDVGAAEEVQ